MSDSIHRRRVPTPVINGGRSSKTRYTTTKQQVSRCISDKKINQTKSTNLVFERSFSEPNLKNHGESNYNMRRRRPPSPMRGLTTEESDTIFNLPRIRSEILASSPSLLSGFSFSSSSSLFLINQKDSDNNEGTKVIINVTVEGSPGPVRAMVKLSCNVEETIKIVVAKYIKEGRTPKLDQDASFELHQSHFSIQCLDKREIIGDIGSRSFYLRKRGNETGISFAGISPMRTGFIPSSNLIESCIAQIIGKLMRRTRKLWNILVCTQ
ncbi:unnamed protein product [Cochlearia groenlandica]